MKPAGGIFLLCLWGAGIAMAIGYPKLPSWQDSEKKDLIAGGWIAGGALLTNDPVPDEPSQETSAELKVELPTTEEIAQDATAPHEIPEKFLPAYFAEHPKNFLIDPQELLSSSDYRDRLGFLNYHASDSSIDLFVYVFGRDQDIPSEVREEEMNERFFVDGRPAVIVFYYLGAPQRSMVYLSPSLTDAVSAPEQRRALASSVMQAFEKTDASEQLDAFLVQMSIRIYWMERIINGTSSNGDDIALPARVSAIAERVIGSKGSKIEWIRGMAFKYAVPGTLILGSLLAAFCMDFWLKRRMRFEFPDFEVEPRLGGAHAAGVGAVISFASAAVPPARQRDQVPDYLRRA